MLPYTTFPHHGGANYSAPPISCLCLPAPGCIYSPVAAVYLRALDAIQNGMGGITLFVGFVQCAGMIASAQSNQIAAAKARVKQRRWYMIQANGSSFPMDG